MTFDHPPRGTCVPDCPIYGRCHCGCGKRAVVAPVTRRTEGVMGGRPRVWRGGHNSKGSRTPEGMRRAILAAIASRDSKLVPRERLLPLAKWLVRRYGGPKRAAKMAGLPRQTFNNILYGDRPSFNRTRYDRTTTWKIIDAVLAHRIPEESRSMWDVPRRMMTDEERDAERRRLKREERAEYRRKGAA